MTNENETVRLYKPDIGIDGTIPQLIDWAYRYDRDYSDEALEWIHEQAKAFGFPAEKYRIPLLVKNDRNRKSGLPYEQMMLDKLVYGKISFSSTEEYGEVEVYEDRGYVVVSVSGVDEEGTFVAASRVTVDEFMGEENDHNYLETLVGNIMTHSKQYEEEA